MHGVVLRSQDESWEGRREGPVYRTDPIRSSLAVLGRKWTFLILRDIAFLEFNRFGQIRRNNEGLTARVLSRRLKEMTDEGLLSREVVGDAVRYRLTTKGEDAVHIVVALLRYGIRHHMEGSTTFDERTVLKRLRYRSPPKAASLKSRPQPGWGTPTRP